MVDVIWLIPALPLAGFVILLVFGRVLGEPLAGWLATLMCAAAWVVTVGVLVDMVGEPAEDRSHVDVLWSWIPVGSLRVDMALLADPLSIVIALFVTGVGALIHLYSIGYMHGDPKFSKFFLYLNLFIASMLLLVLGENLVVTFLGWEGVGMCSYLLISFWHTRDEAATAGKKAFVTNRVGDWGFMVAMFLAFGAVGTLSYQGINEGAEAGAISSVTATAIVLMLLVGAVGKSAQLPLQLWLPDAMAGPTPVSALIHAATMVTAGVFLLTRMNPLIAATYDWVPTVIAVVGVVTALFAATAAIAQNDIKRVLAYSTISQLGFMFVAIGTGAYVAAIFHMITHAFFKALLFLGSGSVIHGMHGEQDMRRMGALRKVMPITFATFLIGYLAISGIVPFAGFWSKDEILLYDLADSGVLYVLLLAAAFMTAFYMTRQLIMVFFGRARWHDPLPGEPDVEEPDAAHGHGDPHESPTIMLIPLLVLAFLSFTGGGIQLPVTDFKRLEHWLEPVVEPGEAVIGDTWAGQHKLLLAVVALVVALLGILVGWLVYERRKIKAFEPAVFEHAWYYDDAVTAFAGGPGREGFEALATFDSAVIDGAVNGVGHLAQGTGREVGKAQTGLVRTYAAILGVGAIAVLAWFVVRGVM